MKELRITGPLPDDEIERSKIVAALEPHLDAISKVIGANAAFTVANLRGSRAPAAAPVADKAPEDPPPAHPHTKAA
jgi:hypothetical protein